MDRIEVLDVDGCEIICIDLSGIDRLDAAYQAMAEVKSFIGRREPASLLTLTDVTGSISNTWNVLSALRGLLRHNARYVRAGAVIGLSQPQRIVFDAVTKVTRRRMSAFRTREEAVAWLKSVENDEATGVTASEASDQGSNPPEG